MLSCTAKLPSLALAIDKRWLVINASDMILDISANQDKTLCMLSFLPNTSSFWVLGQHLYKDYYVVHDPDNFVMSFAPTEERKK